MGVLVVTTEEKSRVAEVIKLLKVAAEELSQQARIMMLVEITRAFKEDVAESKRLASGN